jgi:RNA polymerase sigma-70 factor (ECF subfamily)
MLQLRYFEGFSLAEIAQLLDVPLGTVCTKIHRSLKTIQDSLVAQGIRTMEEI